MIVIKLIGVCMTIASSAAIGFYFSTVLKGRIEDLKDFKKILIVLKGDIRYANTPLPEAMESIAKRHQGQFHKFFIFMNQELSERNGITFYEIWKQAVEECLKSTCLSKKDLDNISKLGENLGHLDKDLQMNTIDLFLSQLELEINESTSTMKEKSRLYNVLGVMCGLFITIVII